MDSYFAPAERDSFEKLQRQIHTISCNPVIDGLMQSVSGLFAVLNDKRQVLSINESFLHYLNLENTQEIIGLRPGEVVHCAHANDMEGGCGTSEYCSSCGAAIAIVSSLATHKPVEKKCIISIEKNKKPVDLFLQVRSSLIEIDDQRFILLFIQDITVSKCREELERVFFHDINNLLMGLIGTNKMLRISPVDQYDPLLDQLERISNRIAQEVHIQKNLLYNDLSNYHLNLQEVSTIQVVQEIVDFISNHPMAASKHLHLPPEFPEITLRTDISLLLRILSNMLTNAFEASDENQDVRFWLEKKDSELNFNVWNHKPIPKHIAPRIFQRHFSTKKGVGRGLGTYSMKLLGENLLKGQVFFNSGEEGTTFTFSHPL